MTETHKSLEQVVGAFFVELQKNYLGPLYKTVVANPELRKTVPGFLLAPEMLVIHIGRTHIGVEYIGPELIDNLQIPEGVMIRCCNYTDENCNLMEKIIGFPYDSTTRGNLTIPLPVISEDFIFPTNKGLDKLSELNWNFAAQSAIIGINVPAPSLIPGQFTRLINSFFFDANDSGLITRRIKWLDLIPVYFNGDDKDVDVFRFSLEPLQKLAEMDAHYKFPLPDDYKYRKLPVINRFVEIWGNSGNTEPEITSFLADRSHRFILTMRFGAVEIFPELICEWQSESRERIKPDFFVLHPNGYADIVEFKLPNIGKNAIVGKANRETFSAWLASYVAQTRVYSSYFDDPNNRRWFEGKYGFKVHKPKRWLVVGRRSDFSSDVWREVVADHRDLDIITYDDLIDGVSVQFYK